MEAVVFLVQNPGPVTRAGQSVVSFRSLPLAARQTAFSAMVLPRASHSCAQSRAHVTGHAVEEEERLLSQHQSRQEGKAPVCLLWRGGDGAVSRSPSFPCRGSRRSSCSRRRGWVQIGARGQRAAARCRPRERT